jgi:ribosomal protein S27AE
MSIVFQAMNRTFHTEVCPRCRAGSARIAHQNLVFYCEDCGHSWLDVITSPQADRRESSMADRRRTSRTDRRKRNERAGTIADVES